MICECLRSGPDIGRSASANEFLSKSVRCGESSSISERFSLLFFRSSVRFCGRFITILPTVSELVKTYSDKGTGMVRFVSQVAQGLTVFYRTRLSR